MRENGKNSSFAIGDNVRVELVNGHCFSGTVVYVPSAPGDAWIIMTNTDLVSVQSYTRIWKTLVNGRSSR